jgi:ElaB/YqjD/DUF883 family membrane-anchored ribosome-binding protein
MAMNEPLSPSLSNRTSDVKSPDNADGIGGETSRLSRDESSTAWSNTEGSDAPPGVGYGDVGPGAAQGSGASLGAGTGAGANAYVGPADRAHGSATGGDGAAQAHDAAAADLLQRVVQGAHQAIDRLAGGMTSAGEMLSDRGTQAREVGDEWTEGLRSTVRQNPLSAIATALAVGLLVARLTR